MPAFITSAAQVSKALGAEIVRASKDPAVTARELALLARMALAEGAGETARALALRARGLGKGPTASSGRAEAETAKSPVPGVTPEDFDKLADALETGRSPNAEAQGRVGVYGLSVRRLADLGIVSDPKHSKSTWTATWTSPTKEEFSSSLAMQRDALGKSLGDYASRVRTDYGKAIGKEVGGAPVTLSGLLAVAHVAGLKGLETWLRDGEVRKKFPGTTKLFEATNAIF